VAARSERGGEEEEGVFEVHTRVNSGIEDR